MDDQERWLSKGNRRIYTHCASFEQIHLNVYKELGFHITMTPRKSVQERCRLTLSKI